METHWLAAYPNRRAAFRLFAFLAIILGATFTPTDSKFLHKASSPGQNVILPGHTLTDGASPLNVGPSFAKSRADRHMVDFYVHLERNVVVWDELKENGVSMKCTNARIIVQPTIRPIDQRTPRPHIPGPPRPRNPDSGPLRPKPEFAIERQLSGNGIYSLEIIGGGVELSDFSKGTVLVISSEDWETQCGSAIDSVPGVDEEDDTLFLEVQVPAVGTVGRLTISARRISGETVAPIVDVEIHNEATSASALPQNVVFEKETFTTVSRDIFATDARGNGSLSVTSRPSFSYSGRIPLSSLGHIELKASMSAGISRIRFTRLSRLEFKWEQYFSGSFDGGLQLSGNHRPDPKTGVILRQWIPGLSFSAGIPFIARVRAGAFVGVNWIAELDFSVQADIKFSMRYSRREAVTAQILPPGYKAENLLPPSAGSAASASLTLDGSYNGARFTGFVGIRPQIGVGIEYKRRRWFKWKTRRVDGNIGANIGLEAFAGVQIPPFQPYTGSGGKLGTCDRCHALRGQVSVKGKKLSAQLVVNNDVRAEHVFVQQLFTIPLGTICALPVSCSTQVSPTSTPTPSPASRHVSVPCGFCSVSLYCPFGYVCRLSQCQAIGGRDLCGPRNPGTDCRRCAGACFRGFCDSYAEP